MIMEPVAAPQRAAAEPVQAYAAPEMTETITTVAPPVYVTPRAAQPVEPVQAPVEPVGAPVEPVQAAAPRVVITTGPTTVAPPVYVTPRAAQPVEPVQA